MASLCEAFSGVVLALCRACAPLGPYIEVVAAGRGPGQLCPPGGPARCVCSSPGEAGGGSHRRPHGVAMGRDGGRTDHSAANRLRYRSSLAFLNSSDTF